MSSLLQELPQLLPWLVILPLFWALFSLALGVLYRHWIAGVFIFLLLATNLILIGQWLLLGDLYYSLGDWDVPLGIQLRLDGVALAMVTVTSLVTAACSLHASTYLDDYPRAQQYFWPLLAFTWASLNVIWLSADLFNLYVGLELLGLSAVGLVALTGQTEALGAALRYLYAALLGSLAYLLGVALIYSGYGQLDLPALSGLLESDASTRLALALMTLGLLLKTAIFPLHIWLPPAHGKALPPVSALLSALVVKASFYILVRLWLEAGLQVVVPSAAQFMGALGAGAVFWGGWMAWRQTELKMLVAYSTVAQLGYLMLIFPLMVGVSPTAAQLAWEGGWLQLIAHALAKAAMFLAAGNLVLAMRRPDIIGLHGVGRFLPFSLLGFGLAGVSIMGLPPSGGFMAKWLLLQSALASGQWWWLLVLAGGSALSAVYIFKVYQQCYIEDTEVDNFRHPSLLLDLSSITLALLALSLGIFSAWPQALLATALSGGGV
ncbi:Formate hydrogenlyase subunit 3/Multisubunit Na+/H+ antiporter, MnhD subunit [Marinospirillum celere]|uniref:Formate hydrogenlyase subunit 3/Multisubunit Na+/H+ antiporter, MnhD subunit n=1 Tax=Marinospirillum celere TaxID=1122252 RepID=A0A1I1FQN6_9GAMM|nr:proton-conducting transporter membrane subunit [Marinospirillum celere]SFC01322.1 Formate hydrogenlyase subunit 3/Multisubunit Na+/H+ antiporter, MnhD subunit [Marinospirillum celere]